MDIVRVRTHGISPGEEATGVFVAATGFIFTFILTFHACSRGEPWPFLTRHRGGLACFPAAAAAIAH